jgi:4,5-DOPA dioxygenase extradiol
VRPETLHDFDGFPQALFDVRYPAPGNAGLAKRVAEIVAPRPTELDPARGLDHGAWGVLAPMYPNADIPVVQLSLDTRQPAAHHYHVGQALNPLRDEGVLVVGSGNIVHNLRYFDYRATAATDWALRFNETVKQRIASDRRQDLIDYENLGADAALAVPTSEHYLPLLYVLALARPGEPISFFNDRVTSSISMTSVAIGAYG